MNDNSLLEIMEELISQNEKVYEEINIPFGYREKFLLCMNGQNLYVKVGPNRYFGYAITDRDDVCEALLEDWDYITELIKRELILQEDLVFLNSTEW